MAIGPSQQLIPVFPHQAGQSGVCIRYRKLRNTILQLGTGSSLLTYTVGMQTTQSLARNHDAEYRGNIG